MQRKKNSEWERERGREGEGERQTYEKDQPNDENN